MARTALVLHTSSPPTAHVEGQQRELLALLAALRVAPRLVDGADAANAALRARLWAVPGATRATYPFLFIMKAREGEEEEEEVEAVGAFDACQALHEDDGGLARRLEGCTSS
jgi:hypothetical protein